jgi:hypothetical protein
MQIVWVLAAGGALASLPFLQYRWAAGHHHGQSHVASVEHDQHAHGGH